MINYSKSLQNIIACLSIAALLAGCQSMGMGVDPSKISAVSELPAATDRDWPDQKQDVLNQRARVELGLIRSPVLENYLNGLYNKIKKQAGVPNWQGKVYIVANSSNRTTLSSPVTTLLQAIEVTIDSVRILQ